MPLFEVAILKKPTKQQVDDGSGKEELVFGPKHVVAKDDKGAGMQASRDGSLPADLDWDRCEVIIRPF